jgi:hypothetical protein
MNPNSPNQQPAPGAAPSYAGQQPGVPYVPQHGLPQTAANISVPQQGVPQPPQQPHMPVTPQGHYQAPQQPVPGAGGAVVGQAPAGVPGAPGSPGVKPAPQVAHPNSTQNALQIAEVRDGIVIMSDGSFRSVVMVKSINFDLMSRQEQEAVEYNYQNFLNSLYFPIQIFIRSQKVDIAPYLEKLDKIRSEHDNMLLALLMDDYIGYITALAQQTNIMDKKFYIVIPYFPHVELQKALTQSKNFITGISDLFSKRDQHVVINEEELEKAKTELRTRVQTVLSGLLQSNIQGLPLDTQELIELYYDTYNPDTATRQQLKNFNNLSADIISQGEGVAPQPHLDRELS